MKQLYENQKDMTAVATKGTAKPPADNNNKESKVDTDKFVQEVVAVLAAQKGFMNDSGKEKKTATCTQVKTWQQWKFYCFTCGCNLSHTTCQCTQKRKQEGHNDHLDATYTNQKEGKVNQNHL